MDIEKKNTYRSILKVTSLFASVRILTILINVIKNKIIAIWLGTEGVGYFGVFTNTLALITSFSDLGLSKSSVRNISEASGTGNTKQLNKTIHVFKKLLFITSLLGALTTLALSYPISIWTFGTPKHTWSFILLSVAVFFTLISQGQLAILQGTRKIQYLAKASSLGALTGLLISVPIFYFFEIEGVILSVIISALISFSFSGFYLRKIKVDTEKISVTQLKKEGKDMISLGLSMMLVSVMVSLSGFILRSYISNTTGVDAVGIFHAGFTIITAYFGLIFTSITTDYFPRLSAINSDNVLIEREVNQQADITLILICPLLVALLLLMPFFVQFLYSEKFLASTEYINWAIFGIIFQAGSQMMGLVLLAKNNSKVYIIYVVGLQLLFIGNNILWYDYYSFKGLGISYSLNMLLNLFCSQIVMYKLYGIRYKLRFFKILAIILLFATGAFIISKFEEGLIKYTVGGILFIISLIYTMLLLKKLLQINSFVETIRKKMNFKKK